MFANKVSVLRESSAASFVTKGSALSIIWYRKYGLIEADLIKKDLTNTRYQDMRKT